MRPQPRPLRSRLALAAPLGVSLVLALGACGAEDDAEPTSASSSPVAEDSAGGSDDGSDVDLGGEPVDPEELAALVEQAVEEATTARMRLSTSAGGQEIEGRGEVDLTGDQPALALAMTGVMGPGAPGAVEVRLVDGTVYVQVPQLDDRFLRLDLDDPSDPLGGMLSGTIDPRVQLESLTEGLVAAAYVGEVEEAGETLSHYRAAVDTSVLAERTGLGSLGTLPGVATYDVWFDEEGRFRRLSNDLGGAMGSVVVELDDWGRDVSIRAPRPGQVTDGGLAG